MSDEAERLRAEVLRLPATERAELAYCLIRSLDNEDDTETSVAREVELERRWQESARGEEDDLATVGFAGLRKKCW